MKQSLPVPAAKPKEFSCFWTLAAVFIACFCSFSPLPSHAEQSATVSSDLPKDLTMMRLEDLMEIEITSAGKKTQKLLEAASAIFVITPEDIRRSGATSIPEALRIVPGLEVASIDANTWSITSRGFNGRFANKLLVLIDGRSVYTPLFSGVYWGIQDVMLEDLERIEVIRGPGATLWGANAVNGVINIITKQAKETQGVLLTAGGGNEEQGFGAARYGGKISDRSHYRLYAKSFKRDEAGDTAQTIANDDWNSLQTGFRTDWQAEEQNQFTLQGDIYYTKNGQHLTLPLLQPPYSEKRDDDIDFGGGNILCRWKHKFSLSSDLALQLYYDRSERNDIVLDENSNTFDFDSQYRFGWGERQEIVAGLGYRFFRDSLDGSLTLVPNPACSSNQLFHTFVQDEITIVPKRLHLIVGSKFEHNDYTGWEVQPNVRVLARPHPSHTLWASVSRAVRTPSRGNQDLRINYLTVPSGTPLLFSTLGNDQVDSEELVAYEAGYRTELNDSLFVDIAAFYNDYDKLMATETLPLSATFLELSPAPMHVVVPSQIVNKADGQTYGFEVSAKWEATEWWRWAMGYSFLKMHLRGDTPEVDTTVQSTQGSSPQQQVKLQSMINLPANFEFDMALYYVDSLPAQNISDYFRFDVRLGWHPSEAIEISVTAQNLLDDQHPEFNDPLASLRNTEVERSIYGKATWQFF